MKIVISTTQVPFTHGGAEIHAESLKQQLMMRGHEVEIVSIPFKWYPPEAILEHVLACRLIDLTESNGVKVDKVIGLKFPAYHIKHPNKTLWILHQHRAAFDLWQGPECDLSHYPNGLEVRDAVGQLEANLLLEAKARYANSLNVAKRLETYCGLTSEALYHPPQYASEFYCEASEDYFYYPSRIGPMKRQALVLEALALTKEPVKIRFSGSFETPVYEAEVKALVKKFKLEERITWMGAIEHVDLRKTYARSLAVLFTPIDEDYGYVTSEAMLSSKGVITCCDSGGPLEFVSENENGTIVEPTATALAEAMDRCWRDRALMKEWGARGRAIYDAKNINWDYVIERLL